MGFEQPLLQNFGSEINQLLNRTPAVTGAGVAPDAASAFNTRGASWVKLPQFTGTGTEGILVSRFARTLSVPNSSAMSTACLSMWKRLTGTSIRPMGSSTRMRKYCAVAHKSWVIFKAKYEAGAGKGAEDYFPALAQYEEFRGNRLAALGEVLDKERNLRRLIGLPVEDGTRLVPITPPTLTAGSFPDWETARQEALARRPELGIARDNLRAAQYNLIVAKNFLKPDLRFFARYSPVGFGTQLTGGGTLTDATGDTHPSSSVGSLASDHFNDWTVGVNFTVPLGQRLEHSVIRAARLGLAQAYASLQDQEDRATSQLQLQYQKLAENYRLIERTGPRPRRMPRRSRSASRRSSAALPF